jgi:multidrug efflux system membrane fusion protein
MLHLSDHPRWGDWTNRPGTHYVRRMGLSMKNLPEFLRLSRRDLLGWGILLLAALNVFAACSRDMDSSSEAAVQRRQAALPVSVQAAVEKTMPVQIQAVGSVQAYSTVSVKAQVDGQLVAVHFKNGQCVKAGSPLFTIDPRPFQAQLKQMQATLAKDNAQLENADKELERMTSVVGKGYVSVEQHDQAIANAAALKATVQADEASIESVKLQLSYCFINSPIDGCLGALKVDVGNLVKSNDAANPLVTINQISPIYVNFFIPEKYLPDVRKYMASGKLEVGATLPGRDDQIAGGEVTSMDNTVDPATGTIQLKATFPNKESSLWPGQFVNVVLTLTEKRGAIVIPSQAVQTGQEGQYVFVVKPDLTAEYRPVALERTVNGEAVIDKGLQKGEKVVTDGQLGLSPRAHVKIVEAVGQSKGETVQ